jgi:hypothetical protein
VIVVIFQLWVAVLAKVLLVGDSIHSGDVPFASPHDNTARLGRVGYEEALGHLVCQNPWLILRGDVGACGYGFGFGYNHGGETSLFFYDVLSPSDS